MRPEPAPLTGADPMEPVAYRVAARRQELADTVTLWLRPDAAPIADPRPGQFDMLWAFGIGEAPISLAGLDGGALVHTIRAVGPVTAALCAAEIGDPIGVRGPFGSAWDLAGAAATDVLIVAGGLGLAPLRPVLRELTARRADFQRVAVLVGARTPDALLYTDELERWGAELDVTITVDTASTAWRGRVGTVTTLIESAHLDVAETTAFVCGPEVMMRFAALGAIGRGVAASRIFLSLERNMHCAIGHCGRCQLGPLFICRDGPVLPWTRVDPLLMVPGR